MTEDLVLQSSEGSGKLILRGFTTPSSQSEGWYSFQAILEVEGLRATVTVHDLGPSRLPDLFADMTNGDNGEPLIWDVFKMIGRAYGWSV